MGRQIVSTFKGGQNVLDQLCRNVHSEAVANSSVFKIIGIPEQTKPMLIPYVPLTN
jgi:hypothetical protein